ncbi:MAG: hypothetical protein J6M02_05935 [Clostridia bacterium]|nr:hypothetical protein [Clostridia bacterium]
MREEIESMVSRILRSSNVKRYRDKIRRLENELTQSLNKRELRIFLEYERLVNEELYEIILMIIQMKEDDLA